MITEDLKDEIDKLSKELNQDSVELLEIILNNADEPTLEATLTELREYKIVNKLEEYFAACQIGIVDADTFDIWNLNGTKRRIKALTRAEAVKEEVEALVLPTDKVRLLRPIAQTTDPISIGSFQRIDTDLYYKEINS